MLRSLFLYGLLFLLFSSFVPYASDEKARYEMALSLLRSGRPAVSGQFEAIQGSRGYPVTYYDPGQSLLMLPWLATGQVLLGDRPHLVKAAAMAMNPLLLAVALSILSWYLRRRGYSAATAFFVPLFIGCCSPLLAYAVSSQRDGTIAAGWLALFLLLWELRQQPRRMLLQFAFAGTVAVLGLIKTANFALALPLVAGYLWSIRPARAGGRACFTGCLILLLCVAVSIGLCAGYNYWRFGDIFETGFGERARVAQGKSGQIMGATDWGLAGKYLISADGILVLSPLLWLGGIGWLHFFRRERLLGLVIAANAVLAVLFHASLAVNRGVNFRFLLPAMVLCMVPLVELYDRCRSGWRAWGLLALVLLAGLLQMAIIFDRSGEVPGDSVRNGIALMARYWRLEPAELAALNPLRIDRMDGTRSEQTELKLRFYANIPPLWFVYLAQAGQARAALLLVAVQVLLLAGVLWRSCPRPDPPVAGSS